MLFTKQIKTYDIFISYKSQDVELARKLADILIVSGKKPWFAEYEILLSKRNKFQEAIDYGAQHSTYGLAITNDPYAESPYCSREIDLLLKYCHPGNILEIQLPREDLPHKKFTQLSTKAKSLESREINEILNFIEKETAWELQRELYVTNLKDNLYYDQLYNYPYCLNVKGWQLSGYNPTQHPYVVGGPEFTFYNKLSNIKFNVFYGFYNQPEAVKRLKLRQTDDREIYDTIIKFANNYLKETHAEVKGVHLLFIENYSQFVVSYHRGNYWIRRYSIVIEHPILKNPVEIVFTFGITDSFKNYCHYASVLDNVVKSMIFLEQGELFYYAVEAYNNNDMKKAISKFKTFLGIYPDHTYSLYKMGLCYDKLKEFNQAIEMYDKSISTSSDSILTSEIFYNRGVAFEKQGLLDEAISSYEESIKYNSKFERAYSNRGALFCRKGHLRQGIQDLEIALALDPNDMIARKNLTIARGELGNK